MFVYNPSFYNPSVIFFENATSIVKRELSRSDRGIVLW